MGYEIEKKFLVHDYEVTKSLLDKNFGSAKREVKAGYWWSEAPDPSGLLLEFKDHRIKKTDIEVINSIAEIRIPVQDYQYARIRVLNNEIYMLTVKNKSLVNNVEQNIEYEYELDKEIILQLVNFLSNTFFIFYYNVKDTLLYKSADVSIELSKFNDLADPYLEIEVTGTEQKRLTERLNDILKNFTHYPMREESTSYNQLSKNENGQLLKNKKVKDYSKEALKLLEASLG